VIYKPEFPLLPLDELREEIEPFEPKGSEAQKAYDTGHLLGGLAWEAYYKGYLATHDELTGLLNMRGFRESVSSELVENPNTEYGILELDLGHFKLVNDTFGHREGDELLIDVSDILRYEDITGIQARRSGDEFLGLVSLQPRKNGGNSIVMTPEERVRRICERLYEDGVSLATARGLRGIGFSIAAGGVVFDRAKSINANIEEADKLMYQKKKEIENGQSDNKLETT
jgi:diguanylate cyclase (GGDEF)-like protein